jgi:hypothetical protein
LVEISDEVVDVFHAHRQPDETVMNAATLALFGWQRGVCHQRRMLGE